MKVKYRWMRKDDVVQVRQLEKQAEDGAPWTAHDLYTLFQQPYAAHVADLGGQVIGYMAVEDRRTHWQVVNAAVHPKFRRKKVGTSLFRTMTLTQAYGIYDHYSVVVRETNMPALKFFQSLGFKAIRVLAGEYTTEDGILLTWSHK